MGLDNHLSIYSKRVDLPQEIVQELLEKDIQLCGFDGYSFRGKVYRAIVETICNQSLYCVLSYISLGDMANEIEEFLEKIPNNQTDEIDVRDYIQDYDDSYDEEDYKITKKELESLRDLFRFCEENNLYLHDDF